MAKARRSIVEPFLKSAIVKQDGTGNAEFPFSIPALAQGVDLRFDKMVTFFVGENGSGKSTLLEALAVKAGFPAQGGGRSQIQRAADLEAPFVKSLKCGWGQKAQRGFFLRAEAYYNFATEVDALGVLEPYGGLKLHAQSHGESFMALFRNRFNGGPALYLLDEPKAALSPQRQLSFLVRLNEIVTRGEGQFIIATHSPILMAYPDSTILQFSDTGIRPCHYRETEHFQITSLFLRNPEQFLTRLFAE